MALVKPPAHSQTLARSTRRIRGVFAAIAVAWATAALAHLGNGSVSSRERIATDAQLHAASLAVAAPANRIQTPASPSRHAMPWPHSMVAAVALLASSRPHTSAGVNAAPAPRPMAPRILRGYDAAAPPASSLL